MKCESIQLCLLAAAVALLTSCERSQPPQATRAEPPPRPVRVVRAELRPMERAVPVVGALSAHEEATVAAQVSGQIEKSLVDLGDRVSAGQELALIDTTSYEALVRQSAANLARANAAAANAERNLKRVRELQQVSIASTSELDAAVSEAGKTQADVKAADAADAIARLNLERSRVRAPFDGAIAARIAANGDYVSVGAPIIRLVKTDPLRLQLEVPERDSMAVRLGQEVLVTAEGDTNRFAGRISRIAPAIREQDRMLLVEADVPNPGGLRAGLFARARIIVNAHEPGVTVPDQALITFAGLEKVVLVKEGKAVEKNVATGRRGHGWVEIVSGLGAGDAVVLEPAGLRTGQPVTVEIPGGALSAGGTNMEAAR